MRLVRFRVTNFRSVEDSGWIEASDVTSLIGTNESGKTNLLLPLWKLNPAGEDGAIDLLADAPRRRYSAIRSEGQDEVFIEAAFELDDDLTNKLASLTSAPVENLKVAQVGRSFDGDYLISLPDDVPERSLDSKRIRQVLAEALDEVQKLPGLKTEEELKTRIVAVLQDCKDSYVTEASIDVTRLTALKQRVDEVSDAKQFAKTSTLGPRLAQLAGLLSEYIDLISRPAADESEEARKLVLKRLPKFVYYSNYGNLDSEIYLPHVIDNMTRTGLGSKEAAKVRTLKVLFSFVRLKAQEILELGREFKPPQPRQPTAEEIADIAKRKKERDVVTERNRESYGKEPWMARLALDPTRALCCDAAPRPNKPKHRYLYPALSTCTNNRSPTPRVAAPQHHN